MSVEEIKKREAELGRLREETKKQLLAEGQKIVDALSQIGYGYDFIARNGDSKLPTGRLCSRCHKTGHTKATCPEKE